MGKGALTILLLIISNSFMTMAWYGHLKFNTDKLLPKWGLLGFIKAADTRQNASFAVKLTKKGVEDTDE